jgi:LPS-assembly protein
MVFVRFLLCCLLCAAATPAWAQIPQPLNAPPVNDPFFGSCTKSDQWVLEQVSPNHLRLTGQVQIDCPQMGFFADQIDLYSEEGLRLVATGNVVFTNASGRIAAERVEYNVNDGTGTFHQASGSMTLGAIADRAQFGNQDPDVYFYGDTIEKIGPKSYKITRGGFTTCVQPTPRWEVVSSSVTLNLDDYAIARNMLLRVKGVPLMYLPVIYYPIQEDERATGFLLPTYGTSSLRGQAISNAFFWAIGRSQDATFFHDWFTTAGQGAGAEYRYVANAQSYGDFRYYRFEQRETEFRQAGNVTVLPSKASYQLRGNGTQGFGTALRLRQRIDYSSDITTQQLYQQNFYQASNATRTIEAGATVNWSRVYAGALFQRIETFSDVARGDSQVYGGAPRVTASLAPQRLFGTVYGSVNSDVGYLPFKQIRGGLVTEDRSLARFDVQPSVRAALSRLTFLTVNTTASYRTTYYTRSLDLQGKIIDEPLTRKYLSLRSDVIGPVVAKIWDTPERVATERMKHVIEPVFGLEYLTEVGNYKQVLTQADSSDVIIGGATRFTYSLNNRLFYRARTVDGTRGQTVEFVTVSLQQSYYTNPDLRQFDTQYASGQRSTRPDHFSPVALNLRVSPGARLESGARFEYDFTRGFLQVATAGATARAGLSTINVNYSRSNSSRTSKPTSSFNGGTSLNLAQGRVVGAYAVNWDISQAAILNQGGSVTYMAQCCGIQLEYQRFKFPRSDPNFPIPSDRRFNVSFVLAGLGTFSNFFGAFGGMMGTGP